MTPTLISAGADVAGTIPAGTTSAEAIATTAKRTSVFFFIN
jgi:hypothetical protein